jgi:hypothetical protein
MSRMASPKMDGAGNVIMLGGIAVPAHVQEPINRLCNWTYQPGDLEAVRGWAVSVGMGGDTMAMDRMNAWADACTTLAERHARMMAMGEA